MMKTLSRSMRKGVGGGLIACSLAIFAFAHMRHEQTQTHEYVVEFSRSTEVRQILKVPKIENHDWNRESEVSEADMTNAISGYLQINPKYRIYLTGNTGPSEDKDASQKLGMDRALTVARMMTAAGIDFKNVVAMSKGDTELPPKDHDPSFFTRSSRVEVKIISE